MNAIVAARLANQRLVGSPFKKPAAVVSWLGAVQAQEYAFAKWAISQRTGLSDSKIEAAFNRGDILRTHVLRPTWHFVAPADIRWMLALTGPRIRAGSQPHARRLGVDAALERRATKAIEKSLAGKFLTRTEIKNEFRRARVDAADPHRCALLLMFAELNGLITSGPRRGNQFTYALLDERAAATKPVERDASLGELATRYFQSRRPATIQDFVWWSGLITADARRAVEIAEVDLDQHPKAARKPAVPSVHLLPIYDEYPLSYRDRTAAMPPDRKLGRAEAAFVHLLVINGVIEGFWTRDLDAPGAVIINVRPHRALGRREWALVEREGERHGAFLGTAVRISRS